MRKSVILLILFLLVTLLPIVSSTCTLTLNKATFFEGEEAVAIMSCTAGNEEGRAYTLEWRNTTDLLETDVGVTPSTDGVAFFESFVFPQGANYSGNATLFGTNLEGSDTFQVMSEETNTTLLIRNITFSKNASRFLGDRTAVNFKITDYQGIGLSNAQCQVEINDGDGLPLLDFSVTSHVGSLSNSEGGLFGDGFGRLLVLIGFLVLVIIVLFKALNVKAEISIGGDSSRFNEDRKYSKMQDKLNRIALKNEIELEKRKVLRENHNKKISAGDFSRALDKVERKI